MIDVCYIYNGKKYALGGLVNGEIDALRITKDGEMSIYDIYLDNGNMISLSEKYGLFTGSVHAVGVKELIATDGVLLADNSVATILKIVVRRGVSINVPRDLVNLNNILVTKNIVPRIWTSKKTGEKEIPASSAAKKK